MIRTLLPCLLSAVLAVILRDLACFAAAKIFCWRKRRQTQRQAKQDRELRQLTDELAAKEKAEQQQKVQEMNAKILAKPMVPFPKLVGGPLIITARTKDEVYSLCRCISSNIASQQSVNNFSESSFEEN
jgi:hypothetical protein